MTYSTPATRSVKWGVSTVTFVDRNDVVAVVDRSNLSMDVPREVICFSWNEYAMLPDGAYFPSGVARCYYSKSFILEVR